MFHRTLKYIISAFLVSSVYPSFAIEEVKFAIQEDREENSGTFGGSAKSSSDPIESILTLKSTSIDPETGMELKTYSGKTKRLSVRGKMFSHLKYKLRHERSCVPKDVLEQCSLDTSKTHSSHTRHGKHYGVGGPGYGIFVTDINTHGSNYDSKTRYSLIESEAEICLDSYVYVSSMNKRRGWYEQNHEIYLKCGEASIDIDNDGILTSEDNCKNTPNSDQANTDSDSFGDACDNCVDISNQQQSDLDGDNIGNVCDLDDDNDGVEDSYDNCPIIQNTNQSDIDNDGLGDLCDALDDNAPYDLKIEKDSFTVFSDCIECSGLNGNSMALFGGELIFNVHRMNMEAGFVNIYFLVTNDGITPSESVKTNFWLSKDYNSLFGLKAHDATVTIPVLSPGQQFFVSATLSYDDFKAAAGRYYMVIDLESGGNDGNLENNTVSFPINVKSVFSNKRTRVIDSGHTSNPRRKFK